MKQIISTAFLIFLISAVTFGQKNKRINKYSIGLEMDIGHSFPNFDKEQERWKGTFFRFNINHLGTAKIEEENFDVTMQPKGNIIGAYFKILFPTGNKAVKNKKKEPFPPPIIYNPRFLE